ncbi:MAG: MFS transporter [Rhizobiales bacterium 65-79]|jgi:MFS family permease|nr:MFS transporter [Hyphomicrobiales bacterium]OJU06676.1 MAG: MFS transporter [Rhizobiales bacterium 65-79]
MNATAASSPRRIALLLAALQAIVGSCPPIAISMGGLAGLYLLGADKSLATAPVTGFNVGVALGALPAAAIARALGRRNGFWVGTLFSALGGGVAAVSLFHQNFWLFVIGLLVIGAGNSFVQQYRFAAADNAPASFKARAISWVMAGGMFAAIIGPQTVIYTRELLAPVPFAGSFVALIGLAAIGAVILFFLDLPKDTPAASFAEHEAARPLATILAQPRLIIAFLCAVSSYGLMSFVMTGAPLAMVGCGLGTDDAVHGIQWHVMAMFGPSFFTGRLITRFGKEKIVATGLVLLVGCALTALSGIDLWRFWTALVLLGVGWNFGFIGATAILTESYRPSEKNKVQGLHDFLLFGTVAFASLMSGQVYNAYGWDMLNWIVFPVVAICLGSLGVLAIGRSRTRLAAGE